MPYGLTVVEGAIVDLITVLFSDGFESGDTSAWTSASRHRSTIDTLVGFHEVIVGKG